MLASFGGLPHARYNLAFLYERGAGVLKQSTDRCLQLLDAAAEAGHGGAASALAERLFKGVIRDRATEVEDFPEEAIYYWLLAAKEVNISRESSLVY
jgi:TPR repeat protein